VTVYWTVCDAAAQWLVDRLDAEGALPAVRRLRERGVSGPARPARPNCQTPPSLATLFTGTWPQQHAVTGFDVPGAGGNGIAGELRGFDPSFPAVDPVWRTLGRLGLRSAFVHVPWVFDGDDRVGDYVDASIEAYSGRLARPGAVTVAAGETRTVDVGALPLTVSRPGGRSGLRVTGSGLDVVLADDDGWQPVRFGAAPATGTYLRHLRRGEKSMLVHTGAWKVRTAGSDPALGKSLRDVPVFAGEAVGALYRSGAFGPILPDGGDGYAEEVLLSSIQCVAGSFAAAADAVLSGHTADLVVIYLPMTDDIGHALAGWCDPESAAYRPAVADRIWPYIRAVYRLSDTVLGRVLDRAGPGDTVLLGADHGIVGNSHEVHLNDALIAAGLAVAGAGDEIDCRRSPVFYHLANNGSLWLNTEHAQAGTEGFGAKLRQALTMLSRLKDPATGHAVVSGFTDPAGEPVDPASRNPIPATVYVVMHDDYQPTEELSADGTLVRPARKSAAHVVNTGNARLHATFAAAGPGIPAGVRLAPLDNTESAALVLAQLGAGPVPRILGQEACR
jgi:predicted AlkP superfamily phosphohydrolase/phosphomutase